MVIFKSIQKFLAIFGIKRHQHHHNQPTIAHEFNEHNLIIAGILGTASMSSLLYLLEEPSFEDYVISIYATTNSVACTVNYMIMVWKSRKIFEFIKGMKDIVRKSE